MRLIVQQHTSDRIEFALIFGTLAILALAAARMLPVLEVLPPCSFRRITGIACPSCGTTRSLVYLAHGDIAGSLVMNPLLFLVMLVALFLFFMRLATLPFNRDTITLTHTSREGTFLRFGMAIIFLANWMYLIYTQ